MLIEAFDPLGGGLHAERVGNIDDRADDRAGAALGVDIANEASVDLDLVQREALQIGQRRVPGAEVVHGDAHAEFLEVLQHLVGMGAVVEEQALGDLDLQPVRLQAGLQQRCRDQCRHITARELDR